MSTNSKIESFGFKIGDWIAGHNGYGMIDRIIPIYYEYWNEEIPEGKQIGDISGYMIVMRRLCSYEFKVRIKDEIFAAWSKMHISKKDMLRIEKILQDPKIKKRFDEYKTKEFGLVIGLPNKGTEEEIKKIKHFIASIPNNGNLKMTMKDIEKYMKDNLDMHPLWNREKGANYRLQVYAKDYRYRGKEILFSEIKLIESP